MSIPDEIVELLLEKQRVENGETGAVFVKIYVKGLETAINDRLTSLKREREDTRVVESKRRRQEVQDQVEDPVHEMLNEWEEKYKGTNTLDSDVKRLEEIWVVLHGMMGRSEEAKKQISSKIPIRTIGATLAKMRNSRKETRDGKDSSLYADTYGRYGQDGAKIELKDTGERRGRGVFAKEDISSHMIVTQVYGERLTEGEMSKKRADGDPRVRYTVKGRYDNGEVFYELGVMEPVEGEGLGSFVNDMKDTGLQENANFIQTTDDKLYVKTTRMVKAGEEILCKYPAVYWRSSEMYEN